MKKIGSDHTPTTRTLGEISKQNWAMHSDEEENAVNDSIYSEKATPQSHVSFCHFKEISGLGGSRALINPAIGAQLVNARGGLFTGWGPEPNFWVVDF